MSKPNFTHGASGYNNYKCRCKFCTDAWAAYHKKGDYSRRFIDKRVGGKLCKTRKCARKADRAYPTGYCHRCNIKLGKKKEKVSV